MRFSVYLSIVFCAFFFIACHPAIKQQMPEEVAMERILQENPDSLANLLEEKINPFILSEEQKADYARWLTKTHLRQQRSLMNDTLIHYSVDYYKKTDSPYLLETYLLAAEQADWSGTDASRKEYILNEALQVAQSRNDTTTIQTIVSKLNNLFEIPKEDRINELINITKKYYGEQWSVLTYMNLVKLYALQKQNDSVLFYVRKGVELAREQNDSREYSLLRQYSRSLHLLRQDESALNILKELENRLPYGLEIVLDYSLIWVNMGKLDSAQVYIDSACHIINTVKNDPSNTISDEIYIFELLLSEIQSMIDIKKGKILSFDNIGPTANKILYNSRNNMKIYREQQFVQNKLLRDNLNLEIERAKLKQRFLWAGLGLLFVIVLIVFFYQRKLLRKERSVQQVKEQLHLHSLQLSENELLISKNEEVIKDLSSQIDEGGELKQDINLLVEENEALKQKNISLQKDIEQYSGSIGKNNRDMEAYEKLTLRNAKLQERERLLTAQLIANTPFLDKLNRKPHYIDVTEWPEILHTANQMFDGFSYRLSLDFPCLTEEDIQYCCLIKLRFSTSLIATFTGISPSSVTKRKRRIKEKMNQQRPAEVLNEQAIEIYIWNYT